MKRRKFISAGKKLHGAEWQSAIAAELEISRVTVWRYATGRLRIPKKIVVAVAGLLAEKGSKT